MGDALEIGVAAILAGAEHAIKAIMDDNSDPAVVKRKLDEFHRRMRVEADTLEARQQQRFADIEAAVK